MLMNIENSQMLDQELDWLRNVIDHRFNMYFQKAENISPITEITPPDVTANPSSYATLVGHYKMGFVERLAIVLSLASHFRPQVLDVFYTKNKTFDRRFTEFGGVLNGQHSGFLPTGQTLAFLLAEVGIEGIAAVMALFDRDHYFVKHNVLKLERASDREPFLSGLLTVSDEYLGFFIHGELRSPDFGSHFPARKIQTSQSWEELILNPATHDQVMEIHTWIRHGPTLMKEWGMKKKLRPGYRAIFYGPPGTGKTMTACLLGKTTGRDVYKIDLSLVVSKYIGETEKNLAKVFDQAEHKNWILFFDEADALFGKRGEVQDARDRYANQEVSYLLQRIEVFNGIVILASNLKDNIDEAFARRFESMIYFSMPIAKDRLQLWEKGFSPKAKLDDSLDLQQFAEKYELSGGAIMNVIRYASLKALERESDIILAQDLIMGVRKEFAKEGRSV